MTGMCAKFVELIKTFNVTTFLMYNIMGHLMLIISSHCVLSIIKTCTKAVLTLPFSNVYELSEKLYIMNMQKFLRSQYG